MVSERCKIIVKIELEKYGYHCLNMQLGEAEIQEVLKEDQEAQLNSGLAKLGFGLLNDKKSLLIEKIKVKIIELVHYSEDQLKVNFSVFLSEELGYNYTYLANLFSENQGMTIEHFILSHKIERVKELLIYNELNINEIADKVHYSSAAHLTNQFRKMTGLTPSQYRRLRIRRRNPIENV